MTSSQKAMIPFYQCLGKLFYSVAMADKTVPEREVDQLKKLLRNQWLPLDQTHDIFGTDSAYQIEIVFDWLVETGAMNTDEILKDFKIFKTGHEKLFTKEVKELILKTAFSIAKSFSGKNKSELIQISQLERILSN